MERGKRNGGADARRNGFDVPCVYFVKAGEIFLRPDLTFFPDRGRCGILQAFDEGVDLRAGNAFEIIADAHVEHESVGSAEVELPADKLEREPGLHILLKRFGNAQLGRPLYVIAFVGCKDAGLGNGQIFSVERLHRF
ncbi:hypothetical protein SDC9_78312 [bioreactor metagenome]|uniref:Uncharacterized protein n=1 Tax=bioreactor metagenome TaxID=1076179 RepID=A0A644YT49_9ZZZZ